MAQHIQIQAATTILQIRFSHSRISRQNTSPTTCKYLRDIRSAYQFNKSSHSTPSTLSQLPRTSALPHPTSPISPRDLYQGSVPLHLRRTSDLTSRSPSLGSSLRGVPYSPILNSSHTTTATMDDTGNGACPPFGIQSTSWKLQGSDGAVYQPEIYGKIEKGFFLTENTWTCYRRNYFTLNCSYTIQPMVPNGNMKLIPGKEISQAERNLGADGAEVKAFAMCISATVDGEEGKPIELVQHTPKRDKGPQMRPERIILHPRSPQHNTAWGDNNLGSSSRGLYDSQPFNPATNPATEASFERIQFKNATANNGKRRAAQQYYHITIELWAELGTQSRGEKWVKIAKRPSCQMVVRGRSPGHYQSERRGSNASSGPGSGGASGTGSYPSSSISRTPGDMNIGGSSSIFSPQSAYGSTYDHKSHTHTPYRPNLQGLTVPVESIMPEEAQKDFYGLSSYAYHYGPIYEGQENRYHRSNSTGNASSVIKNEPSNNQTTLPSISSTGSWDKDFRWGFSGKSEPHYDRYAQSQYAGSH